MERPKPTKALVNAIVQGDSNEGWKKISDTAKGISELNPLGLPKVYPFLDLEEALYLAGESWRTRGENKQESEAYDKYRSPIETIAYTIETGKEMLWPSKHFLTVSAMPEELMRRHEQMNPFRGYKLRERISLAAPENVLSLQQAILRGMFTGDYDFEGNSERRRQRGIRDREIIPEQRKVAYWRPSYSMAGAGEKIKEADLKHIVRAISNYSRKYEPELDPQIKLF